MSEVAIGAPARYNVFLKFYSKSFVLIENILVPTSFLDELAEHLMPWNHVFENDDLLTAREMVGECFWAGLSTNERTVLGACLLILIEQGRVVLDFPARKQKAA